MDPMVPGVRVHRSGSASGPLAGTTVVVKDVIDVASVVTGAGNPTWAATHAPAAHDARCVRELLDAGAEIVGKGQCAEFAYSLSGDNAHFGMPDNPAAPDRNPGGSTSGPAAAVGAGLCDLGLGTDTLGSVRVPASYCGLFGYRPTYGTVSFAGVQPLAPSFDTVGLLARSAETLTASADALVVLPPDPPPVSRVLRADDAAYDDADGDVRVFSDADGYDHALDVFATAQAYEVWQVFGPWVESHDPGFGPGVADRFAHAATVTRAQALDAQRARSVIARRLLALVDGGAVLALPGIGPAPRRDADAAALEAARVAAGRVCCLASLAGLPAVMVPHGSVDGAPVGLQLVAAPGADRALLALAHEFIAP
jgi:amidase